MMMRQNWVSAKTIPAALAIAIGAATATTAFAQSHPNESDGGPPPIVIAPDARDDNAGAPLPDRSNAPAIQPGNQSVEAAARLRDVVRRIDPRAEFTENSAQFTVSRIPVFLVYDLNADRMRLMAPVVDVGSVDTAELFRLMQANFESALDARYAIARDTVWSTFIHPLSPLGNEEFASGLGQVVNLVLTHGQTYNSGAVQFGGGDSAASSEDEDSGRELIEELEERSRDI